MCSSTTAIDASTTEKLRIFPFKKRMLKNKKNPDLGVVDPSTSEHIIFRFYDEFSPSNTLHGMSISRRIRYLFVFMFFGILGGEFLAKPILHHAGMTEVQLLNELMSKGTSMMVTPALLNNIFSNSIHNLNIPHNIKPNVMLENTLRFINATAIETRSRASSASLRTKKEPSPGSQLASQGALAKHPVIMVPGFITSGLEFWSGEECYSSWIKPRQKVWGSLHIFLQSVLSDLQCYTRHLALDPITGQDPPNIKLRSASGFDAADYFMSTLWVWDKLIDNLSEVGYDASNMIMMGFDWRLGFPMLEERDGYFTKLKVNIEAMVKLEGQPAVITSHSFGSQVVLYFFKWVTVPESDGGGGGGEDWVEKNIHSFVNVAGPLLGVPKAVSALLSGEMKDTADLMGPMGTALERVLGRKNRKDLFTTWTSLWEMLPIGGDAIWGTGADILTSRERAGGSGVNKENGINAERKVCQIEASTFISTNSSANFTSSPIEDGVCFDTGEQYDRNQNLRKHDPKKGAMIAFSEDIATEDNANSSNYQILPSDTEVLLLQQNRNVQFDDHLESGNIAAIKDTATQGWWSSTDVNSFLKEWGGGYGSDLYGASLARDRGLTQAPWNDPTSNPLPNAPSTKLYCLYGVGIETERAYHYKKVLPIKNNVGNQNKYASEQHANESTDTRVPLSEHLPFVMDPTVNDYEQNIRAGVRFSDGDISVPLVSLGYVCADTWRNSPDINPSGMQVVTKEYAHIEEWQVNDPMRGGPRSSNHIDILGNIDVTTDIIKIATGFRQEDVQDQFVSDIHHIAAEVRKLKRLENRDTEELTNIM